ncbi:MAG: MerR family transcriptional regulator [Anaerolineales bacterium]|nr:MerR family transcriptional regulator [Anaerolineales bacterium]
MASAIRLNEFATTPLYNIKAVVQATRISPSTLRAWERRYNMCQPERSESGYRLYSDRDIAIIRWLKAQVDAGMSISQAVAWLQNLATEGATGEVTQLPDPTGRAAESSQPIAAPGRVQTLSVLKEQLLNALLEYDENGAEQVIANAFALYPLELIGEGMFTPVMVEIGERWHRGELSVTGEHYATAYLLQRLAAILRTAPNGASGPALWVACAPGERHEMGALLLAINLRRAGFQVRYLGQDLPQDDLVAEAHRLQPAMILFSAAGIDSANQLKALCAELVDLAPPRPIIGYGGRIFNIHPELRNHVAGVYLGATAAEAVESVGELLVDRLRIARTINRRQL